MQQEVTAGPVIQDTQQLNWHVMQSTSDEAPGILAYGEHYLEAHHSPDLFHVYHFVELERGVRPNGQLIAADIQAHIAQVRAIA